MRNVFHSLIFMFAVSTVSLEAAEETFILIDAKTGDVVKELGLIDKRVTPCSTFKIPLSLMGYDAEILQNEEIPVWPFQSNYVNYRPSWQSSHDPRSWIKNSCVWYSQVLAEQLGSDKIEQYLKVFEYGNQDMTGGLTNFWLESSLKISPKEQVIFLRKFLNNDFPLTNHALKTTRDILFIGTLENEYKLYGKTGFGQTFDDESTEIGWFIGWVEKEEDSLIFAYNIQDIQVDPSKRIPRVKRLLLDHTN